MVPVKIPSIEKEFKKFKEILMKSSSFFLAVHLNPDGDAIGSMLALSSMIKRLGKKAYLFSQDPVPKNLSFLYGISKIKNILPKSKKIDVSILLECSTPSRGGKIEEFINKTSYVVNIDHHKTAELYGDVNILDFDSSSTAEIVYRFFYGINYKLNKVEAAYLYTGIVTDTGRFHFPSTSPKTHEVAARLLETGFNFSKINDILYLTKQYISLKMLGRGIESLEIVNNSIAVMTLTLKDFRYFGATAEHTENIINYGMMIPEIKIAVLFKEEPDRVAVTFRSRGNIDVSKIAKKFDGGGHKNSSGCKLYQPMARAKELIISELLKHIR